MNGVSIIIPAYNAERTIAECLHSATGLKWSGAIEILVVNDGSTDETSKIAHSFPGVSVINVSNGGAARATNIGIEAAQYDIVVSLDADAVLEDDWLEKVMPMFDDPGVVAVAGYSVTGNKSVVGKLMGYDVEYRLDRMQTYTDHLYTMNTAYRRPELIRVGMFDEKLRIGYDGDISQRLRASGDSLVLVREAKCKHYWRDDLGGYLKQQYDYAYHRLNRARKSVRVYDQLVSLPMLLETPLTLSILLLTILLGSLISPLAALTILILPVIHLPRTFILLMKKRDPCILLLPSLFTIRNLVWSYAAIRWVIGQALGFMKKQANLT